MHTFSEGRIIITCLIFFSILFLIDFYIFKGIRAILSHSGSGIVRTAGWVYWTVNLLFFALAITLLITFSWKAGVNNSLLKWVIALLFLLYVPKIVFGMFLLGEDVFRLLRAGIVGIMKLAKTDAVAELDFFNSRRAFISQAALLAASIPFAGIIYGVAKGKYNFKVRRVELAFENLPINFDGFKITQISDIHSGSFDNKEEVERAVTLAKEQNSDVVFFTGDLVNSRADEMLPWMDVFKKITAPMGVFSILGNHDYGDYYPWSTETEHKQNFEQLLQVHNQLGFHLMRNENLRLEKRGQVIELIGIENWGRGHFSKYGDLEKAMHGTMDDSFKILLSHDPTFWEDKVMDHDKDLHLTLSGHTHGFQFGFEIPGFRFSPARLRYKRWAGLYEENNRYLYVNRGLGFLGFPGRVGIWPEITVITLKHKAKNIS
jgi:predicted MPP superfamily phosphohydrolase